MDYLILFVNEYPTWVKIFTFTPHESILYPVQVSQLPMHNVDTMKHRPNLSYFAKTISYFTEFVMSLESFYMNNQIYVGDNQ